MGGPRGPHDENKPWEVTPAPHADGPATAGRVAGLLLLYAQLVNTIRHLTVDHVQRDGGKLQADSQAPDASNFRPGAGTLTESAGCTVSVCLHTLG